jgi:2'-5' RNA ligase
MSRVTVRSEPASGARRTVGVVIELPEPSHSELSALRHRAGDPQAANVPPHVTLLPPTSIEEDALPEVIDHLGRVAEKFPAFAMHLSGPGTFRPVSQVVFVQVAAGLSACEQIESAVRSGPLYFEPPFPYHPHVTVAHDVPTEALDEAYDALRGYDAVFAVSGFRMFEQDIDGVWRPQRQFTLDGERDAHP